MGDGHDGIFARTSRLSDTVRSSIPSEARRRYSLHWIEGCAPKSVENLTAKIRYRQQDQECVIIHINNDTCDIEFAEPQFAIAPGQSIVFYDGNICLGGGIILERS